MARLLETVTDLAAGEESLKRRPYGVIEMVEGGLAGVHLRPWPKLCWLPEVLWSGPRFHARRSGDRCLLYYNQPLRHRNFLALVYVVSSRGTPLATFRGALRVLDQIARLKGSDAILCEVSNHRISRRLLLRWGWERHLERSWRRHYIKRFYGDYPAPWQPPKYAQPPAGETAASPLLLPAGLSLDRREIARDRERDLAPTR